MQMQRETKIAIFISNECKTGYQYPDLKPGNLGIGTLSTWGGGAFLPENVKQNT